MKTYYIFRPHPGSKRRALFNWTHWLGGNIAHILAVVTIFFSVKLGKAELPEWMDFILVAYVIFHVLMHLIYSVSFSFRFSLNHSKNSLFIINMEITSAPPPQIIVHQDNSPLPTSITLDEMNYSLWSQLMEMRISARNKVGYLIEDTKRLDPADPRMETWITEKPPSQELVDWLDEPTVDATVHQATHDEGNLGGSVKNILWRVEQNLHFWIKSKILLHQIERWPLPTFYNELVAIFQEIDHKTLSQTGTVNDVVQLHSSIVRLRVHIFLSGLDPAFEQVHLEIPRKDLKLNLESAYAYVHREHQQ